MKEGLLEEDSGVDDRGDDARKGVTGETERSARRERRNALMGLDAL